MYEIAHHRRASRRRRHRKPLALQAYRPALAMHLEEELMTITKPERLAAATISTMDPER